jgi:phage regulator Rha-like protein
VAGRKEGRMNDLQTIGKKIVTLPGRPLFMLDQDVADLYGAETRHINQAIKRNPDRFPEDFCFQLEKAETKEVITKRDNLENLKFRPALPYAFTREGCNMLSAVLNTKTAIARSIQIMRAFSAMERFAERRPDAAFVDAPDSLFLPSGLQMQQIREMYGIDGARQILKDYCGINPGGPRSSITPMEERIIRKNNPNKRRRNETIAELLDRGVPKSVLCGVSGLSAKSLWNVRRKVNVH